MSKTNPRVLQGSLPFVSNPLALRRTSPLFWPKTPRIENPASCLPDGLLRVAVWQRSCPNLTSACSNHLCYWLCHRVPSRRWIDQTRSASVLLHLLRGSFAIVVLRQRVEEISVGLIVTALRLSDRRCVALVLESAFLKFLAGEVSPAIALATLIPADNV